MLRPVVRIALAAGLLGSLPPIASAGEDWLSQAGFPGALQCWLLI